MWISIYYGILVSILTSNSSFAFRIPIQSTSTLLHLGQKLVRDSTLSFSNSNSDDSYDDQPLDERNKLTSVKDAKRELLLSISKLRKEQGRGIGSELLRQQVLHAVSMLEAAAEDSQKILTIEQANRLNGEWTLVYSTLVSDSDSDSDLSKPPLLLSTSLPSFFDMITGNLYKLFFRYAPFLAGSSSSSSPSSSLSSSSSSSPSSSSASTSLDDRYFVIKNQQDIYLAQRKILNTVTITPKQNKMFLPLPFTLPKTTIIVEGEISIDPATPSTTSVIFTRSKFSPPNIAIPLPRPKGSIVTTFCDEDLRISRGGQGGLFIVNRL